MAVAGGRLSAPFREERRSMPKVLEVTGRAGPRFGLVAGPADGGDICETGTPMR